MKTSDKTVLIDVHVPFATRYFLRTDILKTLKKGIKQIVILSPNTNETYFRKEFEDAGVDLEETNLKVVRDYQSKHAGQRWLRQVRLYALSDSASIAFQYAKYRGELRSHGIIGAIIASVTRPLIWILRRCSFARRCLIAIESAIYSGDFHYALLDKWKPDLVVTSSLGYFTPDAYLMRQARKRGIKVLTVILSWDNTTTKGIAGAFADRAIAWTEVMKEELGRYHDMPPKKVTVGGIAHYDNYAEPAFPLSRDRLYARLGIAQDRGIIMFGTGMPVMFHDLNLEVINWLADMCERDKFIKPMQAVVRLHPNYWMTKPAQQGNRELADQLEETCRKSSHITINLPDFLFCEDTKPYDLSIMDQRMLAALLKHSSVVLSEFSTLMLESSLFDTPSINVAFDRPNKQLLVSQQEIQNFLHLKRIIATGGSPVAHRPEQLLDMINDYLADPALDSGARKTIIANECGPNAGNAGASIAEQIIEFLTENKT